MTMTPEQVAAGLSEAQKRKILAIGHGQPVEYPLHASGLWLIERGLVFVNELGARHLTDDGYSVRAILEQQK